MYTSASLHLCIYVYVYLCISASMYLCILGCGKKIFFFNIALWRFKRSALRHLTRISNHFSEIMKIDCTGSKTAAKFWNFPKSTVFRMSIEHFSTFLKIDSIFEFSVPIRAFWYVTRLYLKQTLLQGIPNFEVKIFEKYSSQKKNKNSFEIPWPRAIKLMPSELDFYEACARK